MMQRERRLQKLELRFAALVDAVREAADPFSDEAIYLRLAAGEWQCALKLLERQRCDRCRDWRPEPRERLDSRFTDLGHLRETLERSLGALPDELRFDIARRLLLAEGFQGEGIQG